jgi:subtilisin family serine protease
MAIAPVNKFLTVAVPVAPGEQKIYEVPTGTSAILLYAQVSNVGVGTYPTTTLIHRRESRSTGNTRDIRVIKNIEVPPNDAAILIDGRLVLEKTATVFDRLYITGTQAGIVTITDVTYDEPTGVSTITTLTAHGFESGSEITMSGIAMTCPSGSGITTTIFPSPQKSYIVDNIESDVGGSKTFTTTVGSANGITHTYVSGGLVGPLQMEFIGSFLENSTT